MFGNRGVVVPDFPTAADAQRIDAAGRNAAGLLDHPALPFRNEIPPRHRVFDPFRALQRDEIIIGIIVIVQQADRLPAVGAVAFHIEGNALVLVEKIHLFIVESELQLRRPFRQMADDHAGLAVHAVRRLDRHAAVRLPAGRLVQFVQRHGFQRHASNRHQQTRVKNFLHALFPYITIN